MAYIKSEEMQGMAFIEIVRCVEAGKGKSIKRIDWSGRLGPVYKSWRQREASESY